jgi:hypothetical protein
MAVRFARLRARGLHGLPLRIMPGWIKLHRKILEWEWYQSQNTRALFFHLLLSANYEPSRYMGIDIPIGSLVTGRVSLSVALRLSERQVRVAIEHLKKSGEVTSRIYQKFSVITIVNWNEYQGNDQQNDQQVTSRMTSKRPASDQQTTTSKEDKKGRKEESNTPLPPWLPVIEWEAFKEMRRKSKKSMTPHAEKLAIKKLENYHFEGKDIKEILNYNILNNYQGIFEPKPQGELYGQPKPSKWGTAAHDYIAKHSQPS